METFISFMIGAFTSLALVVVKPTFSILSTSYPDAIPIKSVSATWSIVGKPKTNSPLSNMLLRVFRLAVELIAIITAGGLWLHIAANASVHESAFPSSS